MKLNTTAAILLAMGMAMPAMADTDASVEGEAKVESEGGFFSRTMGNIRGMFGGEKEEKGNAEAAQENAADAKAAGQDKAEAAKSKSKENMNKAKDKSADAAAKAEAKSQAAAEKAGEKAAAAADNAASTEANVEADVNVKAGE